MKNNNIMSYKDEIKLNKILRKQRKLHENKKMSLALQITFIIAGMIFLWWMGK